MSERRVSDELLAQGVEIDGLRWTPPAALIDRERDLALDLRDERAAHEQTKARLAEAEKVVEAVRKWREIRCPKCGTMLEEIVEQDERRVSYSVRCECGFHGGYEVEK